MLSVLAQSPLNQLKTMQMNSGICISLQPTMAAELPQESWFPVSMIKNYLVPFYKNKGDLSLQLLRSFHKHSKYEIMSLTEDCSNL